MREICYCGRSGEIGDRIPVTEGGERALRCPECGHVDHLGWLSGEARSRAFEEAERRHARREPAPAA